MSKEPRFHAVYAFQTGIDDFVLHGVFTNKQDAEALAETLPANTSGRGKACVAEQNIEMLAKYLIAHYVQRIVGRQRAVISVAPNSDAARGVDVKPQPTDAYQDIRAKRERQIEHHGFTAKQDDEYVHGELAVAAIPYIQAAYCQLMHEEMQVYWPFESTFSPSPSESRRDLIVSAAALLVAEIERIDRAQGR